MLLNLIGGDCYFIFDSGFLGEDEYNKESCNYISNMGLIYSESIMPLIECVLLSVDNCVGVRLTSKQIILWKYIIKKLYALLFRISQKGTTYLLNLTF